MKQVTASILLATTFALAAGCSATRNGSMASVTPVTSNERVGSVYLLRGWIGVFSTGINSLGDKLTKAGVHSQVYQEAQWSELANTIIAKYENKPDHEPIVLVGHSYGADDSILITRKLAEHNIKVDLVVTLDPVTPKKVPANITHVYNLYQSSALDDLPFLRGIPLTPESPGPVALDNLNIRKDRTDLLDSNLDHFNIEKKEKIQDDVIAQVLKVCPTRSTWIATRYLRERPPIAVAAAKAPAVSPKPAVAAAVAATPLAVTATATPAIVITTTYAKPTEAPKSVSYAQPAPKTADSGGKIEAFAAR